MPSFYKNLEVLRFIAALSVVIVHFHWFASETLPHPGAVWDIHTMALSPVLTPVYYYGDYGVQFFWLLSGFIFFSQYADKIADRKVSPAQFTALRFSRLYPLHLVTLVAAFILQNVYMYAVNGGKSPFSSPTASLQDVLLHLMMAGSWDAKRQPVLNLPFWSVSLEVLAYVSFFLAMRFAPRITMLLTPVAVASLLLVSTHGDRLAQVFSFFYTGGAVYLAVKFIRPRISGYLAWAMSMGAFAIGAVTLLFVYKHTFVDRDMIHNEAGLAFAVVFVLVVFGCALIPQMDGRAGRIAELLGNTTYSSYMIHFPMMLMVIIVSQLTRIAIDVTNPFVLAVWLTAVFASAVFVFRSFERPAQRWLRRRLSVSASRADATSSR